MTFKSCLKSMRLRTLPLSLSGIIMGTCIACTISKPSVATIVFLALTTALLQIISNLSNELGDNLNGTDTSDRQGIHYSIQDGEMSIEELKKLIIISVAACCVSGLLMIWCSFGTLLGIRPAAFICLGAAAITAALKYTLGKKPYGYRAKGDIFVFIFFGLVSTLGAFVICSHSLHFAAAILPACAIGCFSIGVLNVNNIRDMKTDERTRTTVALKLGPRRARIYQTALICSGWLLMAAFTAITFTKPAHCLYFITLPLYILHLKGVWTKQDKELDPMLPLLVMSTFVLSVLCGLTLIV